MYTLKTTMNVCNEHYAMYTYCTCFLVTLSRPQKLTYTCTYTCTYVQYRSDARYKAHVIYAFARGGKCTCTLGKYMFIHGFIQGDKRVYTRRQTRLLYTLHLICTVYVCACTYYVHVCMYMYVHTYACTYLQ